MGKHFSKEIRLEIVKEALAGIKVGTLARMYGVHPETVRVWVRDHRDEISQEEIPAADEHLQELRRLQEVEAKFEQAKKLLGEKELEIEILRELVKKKNPAYLKDLK
ncbi:transposase [Paenibacillus dendritiformis]|jgi:transposase-like protein|nr:transposase [Paenibacillus dendritiformis]WGU92323.1 transposase [Paenibacillus dendritiformis]WGU92704.1 transposase [Paenibacillus dendritiformis]WGU92916.1 transposase [Paenibacillus dendritiformis]WGU93159.1 transposase [Paenibacillus dendritiformis]WGU93500.1 transposase [Paenibacillus dendritiformis]